MNIAKRGGVRLAWADDELTVYVDAAKLADSDKFDVPEVPLLSVSREEIVSALARLYGNAAAEAGRLRVRLTGKKRKRKAAPK